MDRVYLIINWFFGVFCALLGALLLLASLPFSALPMFLAAGLLIPPIRNFVYAKTSKELSDTNRALVVMILILVALPLVSSAEMAYAKKEKNRSHLMQNRTEILAQAKSVFEEKDYAAVIALTEKYFELGDSEIDSLYSDAKRLDRTEKLLTELRAIPVEKYEENLRLYKKVAELNPGDTKFKNKIVFYTNKLKEREELKKREAAAKKAREEREKAANKRESWCRISTSSSYSISQEFVKQRLLSPASAKFPWSSAHGVSVKHLGGCIFDIRSYVDSQNGFGAMVRTKYHAQLKLLDRKEKPWLLLDLSLQER